MTQRVSLLAKRTVPHVLIVCVSGLKVLQFRTFGAQNVLVSVLTIDVATLADQSFLSFSY